jgi:hypothetical protein
MELDDLNEGGPPKRAFTCPHCGDKCTVLECLSCGSDVSIDEILKAHAPSDLSSHNIATLIYDKERLASELSRAKDELRVAHDMYKNLYEKTHSSPSVYSGGFGLVEPKYIDAIWRSCLSRDKKIEVVEKLKRIATNNEVGFKETEHDNYGGNELPFCNFIWGETEEDFSYWSDIYAKINKQPLSDSTSTVPERAGETFTNVSTGVESMELSQVSGVKTYDVTVVEVVKGLAGTVKRKKIAEVSGIVADNEREAIFLAGNSSDEYKPTEGGTLAVLVSVKQ